MKDIVLGREEVYVASSRIWSFINTDDIVNGINLRLSNMAGGFPFEFNGVTYKDSERLYLCGEYSNNTDEHRFIQDELMSVPSGYAAKRFIKPKYLNQVREGFPSIRLQWMLFCVWQKCRGNAYFRKLLLSTGDAILVENTTKDQWDTAEVWGCRNWELVNKRANLETMLMHQHKGLSKKELRQLINIETNKIQDVGTWKGENNIGKILMICRDCLIAETEPDIDYELLDKADIYILGERLDFQQYIRKPSVKTCFVEDKFYDLNLRGVCRWVFNTLQVEMTEPLKGIVYHKHLMGCWLLGDSNAQWYAKETLQMIFENFGDVATSEEVYRKAIEVYTFRCNKAKEDDAELKRLLQELENTPEYHRQKDLLEEASRIPKEEYDRYYWHSFPRKCLHLSGVSPQIVIQSLEWIEKNPEQAKQLKEYYSKMKTGAVPLQQPQNGDSE